MTVTSTRANDVITISIDGRVDTNTSPQLQQEILTSFQKVNNVILDFKKCEYISSAGLRALLIGQKTAASKRGSMKLINLTDVVREVLAVTKFDSILSIE
ncbi:MAG: STAS domain-containing protein [Lachnospiraceae bacterium]|nr:STAS domain-containing protein [Lachnospiraceae bacterium]